MRNLSRYVAVVVVAGFALSGCGSESGGGSGQGSSTPSPSAPTLPTATPIGAGLPLTVSRTGGFAGFDDQVLVGTDGVATVSSRGKAPVRCKLAPSLLTTITAAAQQVDWAGLVATKPSTRHPDDMIVAVSANGKTARLEDPKLKPLAAPVSKLLTEAANPPGKLCTKI
ncbi:hypothetical protein [Kribbella hippodromi]|uniref:hypothetical protein n=1 Tax=Kribbella hippodromi TaxID=434347 RepID=UPI0031D8B7F9